ncbi:MAG: SdpI family protein [Cyanobacteria bacterium P01_A01_bin.135]
MLPRFALAQSLRRSQKPYAMTWVAAIALLALVHSSSIFQVLGLPINGPRIIGVGAGLLVIGHCLGKVRRNPVFGIRTPWTLQSDRIWNQTNRLGGRLLFVLGLGGAIAAVVGAPGVVLSLVLGGGALIISVGMVIYSYRMWRSEAGQRRSRHQP